jgi:acylphosphatase
MLVCTKVIYSGHVQGVGFRYTAQRLAAGFAVAGYVKNLPGGQVELVAEGEAAEVGAFLDQVARSLAEYIAQAESSQETPQGLRGFRIR